jgi:streptogramin lyase/mono/diheme cytochrome c family protein
VTNSPYRKNKRFVIVLSISFAIFLFAILPGILLVSAAPQEANHAITTAVATNTVDQYQLSYKIDRYTELADSGPMRGLNIYWHKCFVCHNKFQKEAPRLEGLFQRDTMVTGVAPTDDNVKAQIRDGRAGMPSFRTTLSEVDIADVASYLHDPRCCVSGEYLPNNPRYQAAEHKSKVLTSLSGGPTGIVRVASGDPPVGVGVQLIAQNGVRVTVFTDDDGKYRFPSMQSGIYSLRIPSPLEFKPYVRDSVHININGAHKLDDIVVERITDTLELPATPAVESQVSGDELLWNLPGTLKEKEAFHTLCGGGCHSFQQILKNRYDERSWHDLVSRMERRGGGPLINPPATSASPQELAMQDTVVQWLARVRGPGAEDGSLHTFPRTTGPSNRVIVTEYELPRSLLSLHDVYGDGHGNIWYTSHFSRYIGRLDSRTGVVTEFEIPVTLGALPGTHHVLVEKNGMVLITKPWSHTLLKYSPNTSQFTETPIDAPTKINSAGLADFDVTPDGYIWNSYGGSHAIQKIDPGNGKTLQSWPIKVPFSYDSLISWDGNFWAGASPVGTTWNAGELLNIKTGKVLNLDTGDSMSSGRRGGFDPFGNAWFAGQNGTLVEIDGKEKRMREFWPPGPNEPYTDFYAAMPDKNGDVWVEELHGRFFLRFRPRTGQWSKYPMPEPYDHARWVWVDNSLNPVTVWFGDFTTGRIVRIQPMD